jgi:hypothetical protein
MRAASLPRFLLALPRWLLLTAFLVAILTWVLLAFAAGLTGGSPVTPADGPLTGPFRWNRADFMA